MEKKYVANKAFLVSRAGDVLLLRHASTPDHVNSVGLWDVPGGRMEAGEYPHGGLVREIFEETSLTIDPTTALPFHVDLWGVRGDIENEPIVGIFYEVVVDEANVQLSSEHDELLWWNPADSIPDDTSQIVQRAIEVYRRYRQPSN